MWVSSTTHRVCQAEAEVSKQSGQHRRYVHGCQVSPHAISWPVAEWNEALGWPVVATHSVVVRFQGHLADVPRSWRIVCIIFQPPILSRASSTMTSVGWPVPAS